MKTITYVKKAFLLMMAFIFPCVLLAQMEVVPNNSLPTKRILDILIDGSDLWIAGDAGVIKYNKTTCYCIRYIPFKGGYMYASSVVRLAKDHKENIWANSYCNGIGKFDGETWTIYSQNQGNFPQNQCEAIVIDKEDNKWMGSALSLIKFDDENLEEWMTDCGLSSAPFITAMALDYDEILWFGGYQVTCAFGRFTGEGFEYYNMKEGYPISGITEIAVDNRNNIWMATTQQGLIKYDKQTFTAYTSENSNLPNNTIFDIEFDKEGNLWLACYPSLVKFDGVTFTEYECPEIKSWIHCIAIEDNGDIWIGTHDDGLFLFSNGEFHLVKLDCSVVSISENDKPAKNEVFTVFTNASEMVIDFSLQESAQVSLSVFDMQGKEVCTILNNSHLTSGKHRYSWSYTKSPSGIYLVRYVVNGTVNVKKVIIP
jgi:ligand-binding sensor domain-containing protein